MAVVIAGGSGFLGRALRDALESDVVILTRRAGAAPVGRARFVPWTPDGSIGAWAAAIEHADAVVNLAGESIAARRWSSAQKARILDSRLMATRSLVAAIRKAAAPPPVFVSGSAVGYYGPLGDEVVDEDHGPGRDFLANVCMRWEAEALHAAGPKTRVVCIRTGLVLDRRGGALPKMLLPFRLGAGGPVGSGRQYWPWIHLQDWTGLVRFALRTTDVSGPLNLSAPNPVTNRDFARALGKALRRPAWLSTPAFALKLLLGEMAEGLLLAGQRAVPAKAERLGFVFTLGRLEDALGAIFGR